MWNADASNAAERTALGDTGTEESHEREEGIGIREAGRPGGGAPADFRAAALSAPTGFDSAARAEIREALAAQGAWGARVSHAQLLRALMELWGYERVCAFFRGRVADSARAAAAGPALSYAPPEAEAIAAHFCAAWHGCPLEDCALEDCADGPAGAFDGELLGFDDEPDQP